MNVPINITNDALSAKSPVCLGDACWHWREIAWGNPPHPLRLDAGHIHVWRMPLDTSRHNVDRWKTGLAADEREYVERITNADRKEEYDATRFLLRRLYARYLDLDEHAIRFANAPGERPKLLVSKPVPPVVASVSHSTTMLLIAVSQQNIGIDVEHMRDPNRYPHITANVLLSSWAHQVTTATSHEMRSLMFTRYWTICESLFKLRGCGQLRDIVQAPNITAGLWGCHFDVGASHIAALTTEAPYTVAGYNAESLL